MKTRRRRRRVIRKRRQTFLKPGQFYYGGAMVWEVDRNGIKHPRPDITPNSKGKFKHKFFK